MKIPLSIIFLFILFESFSQSDTSNQVNIFTKGNFSLQYPKSWRIDTSKVMGTEIYIFAPLENAEDKFRENVNVMIQNLSGKGIDLGMYKQITESQIANLATEGKVFESTILKADKGEYYKITYAMTQGIFRLKLTSYCFIKDEKAYLITFGSEFDKYEQYQKIGEEILNSFSLDK